MEHSLENTMAVLERTPAALDALLRGLPDVWTRTNEGGETFTAFDVIGHLIHGERTDWMARANMILVFGETKTFERFDRFAQKRESEGKTLAQLLDEFGAIEEAESARSAFVETDAGRFAEARAAPGIWDRDTFRVIGRLGGARSDTPAPDIANHGASVSGIGRAVEFVFRSAAVCGTQCGAGGGSSGRLNHENVRRSGSEA